MDDQEGQDARPSSKKRRRITLFAHAAGRASKPSPGKATSWAAKRAISLQSLIRRQIEAIRNNELNRTIEISGVRFEGSVRKDVEEHCGFFDYGPLTEFLATNFHLGYPADEDGAIFRIDWNRLEKRPLGIHFLLADVPPDKVVIYVLELFDPVALGKSQAASEVVRRELKLLSKSGIMTGVQEIVKFGVRVLTGGV